MRDTSIMWGVAHVHNRHVIDTCCDEQEAFQMSENDSDLFVVKYQDGRWTAG